MSLNVDCVDAINEIRVPVFLRTEGPPSKIRTLFIYTSEYKQTDHRGLALKSKCPLPCEPQMIWSSSHNTLWQKMKNTKLVRLSLSLIAPFIHEFYENFQCDFGF